MDSQRRVRKAGLRIKVRFVTILVVLAYSLWAPARLEAKPVGKGGAEEMVRGWLKRNPRPMEMRLGSTILKTDVFPDNDGEAVYYVVNLDPSGFVIVPADDRIEPIVAFAEKGVYDPSPDNPLGALVSSVLAGGMATVRDLGKSTDVESTSKDKTALAEAISKAQAKWSLLQSYDDAPPPKVDSISDVRVAPLVQSSWAQSYMHVHTGNGTEYLPLYNYYTPGPHYYSGCVATAMAQVIRYHEYPVVGVGTGSFEISVDGVKQMASLRGGDGAGGPYRWSEMVLQPDEDITDSQREAIGALCYDAGVSAKMAYRASGSATSLENAMEALLDTFKYSNAVLGEDFVDDYAGLSEMLTSNIDGGYPTILSIAASTSGYGNHAVVCDGYGYDASTLYHNLNIGSGSSMAAWFALSIIETLYPWDSVEDCIYNIFREGTGEIISGRVLDDGGVPLSGVPVTAHILGGETYHETTNERGIYAFAGIPSYTDYYVTANQCGRRFDGRNIRTRKSNTGSFFSGNIPGVDLVGSVSSGFIELEQDVYVVPQPITVKVVDADLQGAGTHAVLLRTCGGDSETVSLTEYPPGSGVFTGDLATASGGRVQEDGKLQVTGTQQVIGEYEDMGGADASMLRETASIAEEAAVIYETGFNWGLPAGWSIVEGIADLQTWNSRNRGEHTSEYWNGRFMIVDCRNPLTGQMDEKLISRSLDCSLYQKVVLEFSHHFYLEHSANIQVGEVYVRAAQGDWHTVSRYQCAEAAGVVELDISLIAAYQEDVQVCWHFYNTRWDFHWGIDDVKIRGVEPSTAMACDLEFDCDVDFGDFSALAARWQDTDCGDCGGLDLTGDGNIRADDLAELATHWLERLE